MRELHRILAVALVCATPIAAVPQDPPQKPAGQQDPASHAQTAQKTQKTANYYFIFLRRPANAPQVTAEEAQKLQDGHMANIRRLHSEGKLVMAGPFLDDDKSLRGIFVVKSDSEAEARSWIDTDPTIKAGRLEADYHAMELPGDYFGHPAADAPMQNYVMVIAHRGPNWKPVDQIGDLLQRHIAYMDEQKNAGKLVYATPFSDAGKGAEVQGVLIFNTSRRETEQIMAEEPMNKAGQFAAELHPWMSAKGVLPR